MSHYSVLVIAGTVPIHEVEDRVAAMLAPYDEDRKVEPYREAVPEDQRDWHEPEELQTDADGLYRMSTYNPQSKWDWFEIGGRWTGLLPLREREAVAVVGKPGLMTPRAAPGTADIARIGDVDTTGLADRVFAMLTPEGWEAPAEMGWFGTEHDRTEEESAWRERVAGTLASLNPRTVIAVVDCHI